MFFYTRITIVFFYIKITKENLKNEERAWFYVAYLFRYGCKIPKFSEPKLIQKLKNQRRGIIVMEQIVNPKKELYSAFVKASNELKNPKNSMDNPYYKSKYVPLSDIIDSIKPILAKHGLAILQVPYVQYEIIGNRENAVVKVTTSIIHENGETLEFPPLMLKAGGNSPQAIGSAITYGRRYSLAAVFGIAGKEEDDDGNIAANGFNGQDQHSNQPNSAPSEFSHRDTVPTEQNPKEDQQAKAMPNVDLFTVNAKVVEKKEGVTAKGTPYVELVLEYNGNRINAIAKDASYNQALSVEVGQEETLKILAAQGFYFIQAIVKGEGANAE